ncbi:MULTISPECIES: transporter substrate-binding domain-containing protein [Pandoraea]|uniref:transporter substrate-binding domain-containing protein n=1 Tax=Pandoraea TaxID=93217 RepID=UPI0008462D38|nr:MULTISPECIES: transporter substrate-binding domain-containing protein [Pandoraea]MCI3203531.1 ABC transporter substrate-binding protein [Pandoraea sp. LA3]MDN4581557.1 ABC transporter substrate-binding protein [Pandoraea capi]ODP34472.1 ABC transporter substrate-binding protein [Pandoraea sp. ISTKB]
MNRREILRHSVVAGIGAAAAATVATPAAAQATAGQSTFDRVKQSKVLRIAAFAGEEPYFHKDIVSNVWSGACIDMAKDIASNFGASVVEVESTYGNSVLDLQSGKVDIAFALNPTPQRALSIDFTTPIFVHSFTVIGRKGVAKVAKWEDINKPNIRIAVDLGTTHETIARRYLPKSSILGFKNRDLAFLALTSGRADYVVVLTMLAINALKKNPQLGDLSIPKPELTMPVNMGVRTEPDKRWRDFLSTWADYSRTLGTTREWLLAALANAGINPGNIPPEVHF